MVGLSIYKTLLMNSHYSQCMSDEEFVYMALERCRMTLSDFLTHPHGVAAFRDQHGRPTSQCMDVMHDIAQGLASLHERGIVHRDLKPHNVLLADSGRAKLSDMGLSKQLVAEQNSFESHGAGGSSGWQAPEQLMAKDGDWAQVRLPSGEIRKVHLDCRATIGQVSNVEHGGIVLGKAGRTRWLGKRPHNRGVTMNPVDHPMGGGEGRSSGGRHPCSPWGQLSKGLKTRKNKRTDSMIVRRRKAKG